MNDELPDELPDELRSRIDRLASAPQHSGDPVDAVRTGLRRRRRLRAGAVVGGSAVVVAAVAVAAVALPNSEERPEPAPGESLSTVLPEAGVFACPQGLDLFQDPPPIPDLAEQQRIADEVVRATRRLSAWGVAVAEPTHLGVVALVQGSIDAAGARPLLEEMGVSLVYPYDPTGADVGLDDHAQVRQVVEWELTPVLDEVRRATRGMPGRGGFAYWQEAGAIVVEWQWPVPDEVRALAGERPNGAEVIVRPSEYSEADLRRAQRELQTWLRTTGNRDRWSSSVGCADGSGLVIGMVPPLEDRAALQEEIADAVGMPVMVVPEERPVELDLDLPE